jgi:hypothetical protein
MFSSDVENIFTAESKYIGVTERHEITILMLIGCGYKV